MFSKTLTETTNTKNLKYAICQYKKFINIDTLNSVEIVLKNAIH